MLNKKYWGIYIAEATFILMSSYYLRCLFPINQNASSLFIFDLLGINFYIPFWITYPLGILNILLIYLLNKKFINDKVGFLTALVYAISPWTYYSGLINPVVVLLVSVILLFLYGIILCKKSNRLGYYLILITLMALFTVPSLKNSFYADIGIVNTVNAFRGETKDSRFNLIGKFAENKYFYFAQVNLKSALDHLNPITYFTDTGNLVRKSISPPILTGLIIPFLFGLFYSWKFVRKNLYILLVLLLIIPSFLSVKYPEIIKLFVIAPLIYEIIGYGFYKMMKSSNNSLIRLLIFVVIIIVGVQLAYLLADLSFTEPKRLYYMRFVI